MAYTGPVIASSDYDDVALSTTGTADITVTTGARLVVLISSSAGSQRTNATGVTDTQGNTWTQVQSQDMNNRVVSIWHAVAASSGSLTVTATYSHATNWHLCALALGQPADLDTSDSFGNTVNGTTFHAAPVGALDTSPQSLLISVFALNATVTSWSPGTGFTAIRSSIVSTHVYHSQYLQSEAGETDNRCGCTTTGSARNGPAASVAYVVAPGGDPTPPDAFRSRAFQSVAMRGQST